MNRVYFGDWGGIRFKLDILGIGRPWMVVGCVPLWLPSHTHLLLGFGSFLSLHIFLPQLSTDLLS